MRYKAFMSYSHAVDDRLAPALQSALQRFGKPFYRRRAIPIFRDKTSLHLTPELWPAIQQALRESELFLLLASPGAAQSVWVQKEVEEWFSVQEEAGKKVLILLTDGEVEWDPEKKDFDWTKTTALPPNLSRRFATEPLYLDFRGARSGKDLSMRNPSFLDKVATIAAALHGKPKAEMVGEDVRAHRVFRLVSAGVAVALGTLALAALLAAYVASEQRKVAEARRLLTEAELAHTASQTDRSSWADLRQRSLLLADAVAVRTGGALGPQTAALDRTLRLIARALPQPAREIQLEMEPESIDFTADGRRLVLVLPEWVSIRDARSGREIGRLPVTIDWRTASWTPTWSHMAGATDDGIFRVWQIGEAVKELKLLAWPQPIVMSALSPDGRLLATVDQDGMFRVARLADGAELMAVRHEESIEHITFDSSGTQVATAAESIRIFAPPDPAPRKVLPYKGFKVAFSPDGKLVVGAGSEIIAVWDLQSGKEVRQIRWMGGEPDDFVTLLRFSSDSRSVAFLTDDGGVRRYDIVAGEESGPAATELDLLKPSLFGTAAMQEFPGAVELWNTSSGRLLAAVELEGELSAAAFDEVTQTAALAEGTRLRLIDMRPGDEIAGAALPGEELADEADPLGAAHVSTGGETVGIKTDLVLGLWTWRMPAWWRPPQKILDHALSEDGSRVAVWSEEGLSQWIVDSGTGEVRPGPALRFERGAAFPTQRENQDGRAYLRYSKSGRYCIAAVNHRWYVWISATGELIMQGTDDDLVTSIAFDREERTVWYFTSNKELWARDLPTRDGDAAPRRRLTVGAGSSWSSFSPEGRFAYIWDRKQERLSLWEARTPKPVLAIPLGVLDDLHFGWHDRFLIVTKAGSFASPGPYVARVYDLEARLPVAEIRRDYPIGKWAFSGDGSILATADGQEAQDVGERAALVQLTATATGQKVGRVPFTGSVEGMALSHDGRLLCVYGNSGIAGVWDLSNPEEPLEIARLHHDQPIYWAGFTPDARHLTMIDGNGTEMHAHQFFLSTEDLVSRIRSQIRREFTDEEKRNFLREPDALQIILAGIRRVLPVWMRGLKATG